MRDPTEGVRFSQMRMPFLRRNLPTRLDEEDEYNRYYGRLEHQDGLIIRICANSYHLLYEPGSTEWSHRPPGSFSSEHQADETAARDRRRDRFLEKFVNNPSWARGLSKAQVDGSNQRFRSWVNGDDLVHRGSEGESGETKATTEDNAPPAPEPEDTDMADAEPAEKPGEEEAGEEQEQAGEGDVSKDEPTMTETETKDDTKDETKDATDATQEP